MRLIFAGTPEFARSALAALVAAGHDVALVLTRPDRPARRGQQLVASPVKQWAVAHGLAVAQPATLRDVAAQRQVAEADADAMVVAAYGLLLPAEVLAIPRHGCLNIHASLLPRWRGAAPIQRAIAAGDTRTGVTIMQMDAGLDTGPMRLVLECPIGSDDTGGSVHDRLAELGARAIVEALARLAAGTLALQPQPAEGATHAAKLTRADEAIDWSLPARAIVDRIRALDPAPGCTAALAGRAEASLKLWRARVGSRPGPATELPGTVLAVGPDAIAVACGPAHAPEAVELLELQRPGGRRLPARAFLAGFALAAGERFAPP
jgi:methionyl-tRNA formyltransferase